MTPEIPGYAIKRTLGQGGMATVFLAEQASKKQIVALKTLQSMEADGPDAGTTQNVSRATRASARLMAEARLVTSLSHPNIVTLLDVGATEQHLFIAMEYLAGGDSMTQIARGLEPRRAIEVTLTIAQALQFAHENGVIHRDIKPANILFRANGSAVLSDFGVAKRQSDALGLTQAGAIIGSPRYMSPEQASGEPATPQSDLYSLGLVLYEMLVGQPPFRADSLVGLIMKHLYEPAPDLPPGLEILQPVLERLIAKKPADRFTDANRLIAAMQSLPSGLDSSAVIGRGAQPCDEEVFDLHVQRIEQGVRNDLEEDRLVLPSLPEVAMQVRQSLAAPDVNAKNLAAVVSTDPALSARLLQVANSALYARAVPARDLDQVIVRLGHKLVSHIVNLLVVAQLYESESRTRIQDKLRRIWLHSLNVAALCELLADRYTDLEPQAAMLAGLIHDIGKLPILAWADPIPHVLAEPALLDALIDRLHTDLGGTILEAWGYAPEIVEAVSQHEDYSRDHRGRADYGDVVIVANLLVKNAEQPHTMVGFEWDRLPALNRLGLTLEECEAVLLEALQRGSLLDDSLEQREDAA